MCEKDREKSKRTRDRSLPVADSSPKELRTTDALQELLDQHSTAFSPTTLEIIRSLKSTPKYSHIRQPVCASTSPSTPIHNESTLISMSIQQDPDYPVTLAQATELAQQLLDSKLKMDTISTSNSQYSVHTLPPNGDEFYMEPAGPAALYTANIQSHITLQRV